MKKLFRVFLVGATLMVPMRQSNAIVGCLVNMTDLIPRSDVVVVGHVVGVSDEVIRSCTGPERLANLSGAYSKCDHVFSVRFAVRQTLWGDAPTDLTVWVPSESPLTLSCDDRPPVTKMVGLDAILFLERSDGRLWTLEGPNSIYTFWRPIKRSDLRDLKDQLARRREAMGGGR